MEKMSDDRQMDIDRMTKVQATHAIPTDACGIHRRGVRVRAAAAKGETRTATRRISRILSRILRRSTMLKKNMKNAGEKNAKEMMKRMKENTKNG